MMKFPNAMAGTPPATTETDAYILGWKACMAGEDGRYTNPHLGMTVLNLAHRPDALKRAWDCGWQDAMEAEDGEEPEPQCAGFGAAR